MLPIEDQIVLALRRTSQAIDQYSRQLLREFGLTAPQLATLREILAGAHASPMALAEALHVSQPTMTGILARLEQHGLIERKPSTTDRRSNVATVTDKGCELAAKAPPLLRDQFRQQLRALPTWQQTEILSTLQRVAEMMQAPEISDGPFLFNENSAVPKARRSRRKAKAPQAPL
ncbi:MAG: MarR family winged helix-turn-helix transcriptional regulator [Pirellulales bacterium]|nr:MarR family winged helix-turn-helix transcriptional regulator [Pirellulales bacterium]